MTLPAPATSPLLRREGYLEMVERLKPAIEAQVAAVTKVFEDSGLEDIALVYGVDITGNEKKVCVNCGRNECPNYRVNYRTQNVEADLLADSIVVFMEVAERLGARFGVLAFDEDAVPLREVGPPAQGNGDKAEVIQRFHAFRYRHEYPDPRSRAWLAAQLAKWTPADRVKPAVGEPDDRTALKVGTRMLEEAGGAGMRAMIIAKGQVPRSSMRAFEALARRDNVMLSGIAVGRQADAIARAMFSETARAPDVHDLRDVIGQRIQGLIERASGGDPAAH